VRRQPQKTHGQAGTSPRDLKSLVEITVLTIINSLMQWWPLSSNYVYNKDLDNLVLHKNIIVQ
jgi:hypothetical protein